MTPIEEILKISQNLEQILQIQYSAVGRGLREKVDSVADQLPEETVQKIGKLASMRNKATHENIALANEKIGAFRRIAGEVFVSLMLYRPFEVAQMVAKSEDETPVPEFPSHESGPLWKENENFSWEAFCTKILPYAEQYMRQHRLYHELQNDYPPTSQKVQETVAQMLSAIERLYGLYDETLQRRQKDLQTLIDDECRSNAPVMITTQKDVDKLKSEMLQLKPVNSVQFILKCVKVLEWLQPGRRKVLTAGGIKYAFRWCPPGEFIMGGERKEWNGFDWVEKSDQHRVKLTKGFWMLETQVTEEMWQNVMLRNSSFYENGGCPVAGVHWIDCQLFCNKLSQKLGQQIQLPTEAQWEYACRAGTTGDYAGDLDSMAWYLQNSNCKTYIVGQKKPNTWGLYDMHGNVWEWCSDYYDEKYYSKSPAKDPKNTTASSFRVTRGGDCYSNAEDCRSATRYGVEPDQWNKTLGFRVILVSGPKD